MIIKSIALILKLKTRNKDLKHYNLAVDILRGNRLKQVWQLIAP